MTSSTVAAEMITEIETPRASDIPVSRRLSRQVAADIVAIGDMASLVIGGLLPALIYAVVGDVKLDQVLILQSCLLAGFLAHLCLRYRGMYDTALMEEFPQTPIELFIAVCCGLIGVLGIGLPLALHSNMHISVWYASWLTASFTLILLNRLAARIVLRSLARQGRFDQRVAVFGAGPIARRVRDFLATEKIGIYFSGVYDDRAGQDRIDSEGLKLTGKLDDLIAECRAGKIDRIIIALPATANKRMASIIERFESLPVSTHVVTHIASDLLDTDIAHNVSRIGPVGLLDVKKKR
jgi:FlaA1/EpsC-like NDP-sugar epimerase